MLALLFLLIDPAYMVLCGVEVYKGVEEPPVWPGTAVHSHSMMRAHTHSHTQTHSHKHTHTQSHKHTHTQSHKHTHAHAQAHTTLLRLPIPYPLSSALYHLNATASEPGASCKDTCALKSMVSGRHLPLAMSSLQYDTLPLCVCLASGTVQVCEPTYFKYINTEKVCLWIDTPISYHFEYIGSSLGSRYYYAISLHLLHHTLPSGH